MKIEVYLFKNILEIILKQSMKFFNKLLIIINQTASAQYYLE